LYALIWGSGTEAGRTVFHRLHVTLRNRLTPTYSRLFPWHRILILGEKGAGKSSLLSVLHHGQPYQLVDGKRQPPSPTLGAVILPDEKVRFNSDSLIQAAKLKYDVGGDPALQWDKWPELIDDVDPHGIVYMVNGHTGDDMIAKQVQELGHSLLTWYAAGPRSLQTIFIFLNRMDEWRKSGSDKVELENKWSRIITGFVVKEMPMLKGIHMAVVSTQLNPQRDAWPEINMAIHQFASALEARKVA
jgi:hypothetical protein